MNIEAITSALLEKTTTGFQRHPLAPEYHGFTCPSCGRHEFGTSSFPNGVKIGSCHGHAHSGNGCTFSWNRLVKADEMNVMFTMTPEQWTAYCKELDRQIIAERLYATSSKLRQTMLKQKMTDAGKLQIFLDVHRQPETIESRVFSVEEADKLWADLPLGSLLEACGMTVWSLGLYPTKYAFLTDDSNYGWEVLKEQGWTCASFRWRGTSQSEFSSWRDHLNHYYGSEGQLPEIIETQKRLLEILVP